MGVHKQSYSTAISFVYNSCTVEKNGFWYSLVLNISVQNGPFGQCFQTIFPFLVTMTEMTMFVDEKKHEDSVTVTVKFACDKDKVAAAEYSESFSESDQSAYKERQQSLVILITQEKII